MATSLRTSPIWTQKILLTLDVDHPVFGDEVEVEVTFRLGGTFIPGRGDVDQAEVRQVCLPDGSVHQFTSREEDRITAQARLYMARGGD